jgi:hypothetical protein
MNKEEQITIDIFRLKEEGKLIEFINKMFVFEKNLSKESVDALIKVLYSNIHRLSKKGRENYWHSEYDKSIGLIFLLVNNRYDCQEMKSLVYKMIDDTEYIPFLFNIAYFCMETKGADLFRIYSCIELNPLLEHIEKKVNNYYIIQNHNIFEELFGEDDLSFVLYQWATHWGIPGRNNFDVVNKYVLDLMNENYIDALTFLKPLYSIYNIGSTVKKTFNIEEISKIVDIASLLKIVVNSLTNIKENDFVTMVNEFIDRSEKYLKKT